MPFIGIGYIGIADYRSNPNSASLCPSLPAETYKTFSRAKGPWTKLNKMSLELSR